MAGQLLIYGANGYTGRLVSQRAVADGLRPIVAGRNEPSVAELARELGLPHRTFPLEPAALDAGLEGVAVVLNCAGPFEDTALPMTRACLRSRVHYLDITGELAIFQALRAQDGAARAAGVMLLPGAGLDIVPSDCLAAELAARRPGATRLELALLPLGGLSRGTALTMLRVAPRGGAECQDGAIVTTRVARSREVDFGRGPVRCLGLPWGDVCTAQVSTGIPNIATWVAVPPRLARAARLAGPFGWLVGSRLVQGVAAWAIRRRPPGPTEADRARGRCLFWGRASDETGRFAEARLSTPEGYAFTAHSAVALARVALQDGARPGFQTPSRLCGARFVLSLPGVVAEEPWISAGC